MSRVPLHIKNNVLILSLAAHFVHLYIAVACMCIHIHIAVVCMYDRLMNPKGYCFDTGGQHNPKDYCFDTGSQHLQFMPPVACAVSQAWLISLCWSSGSELDKAVSHYSYVVYGI